MTAGTFQDERGDYPAGSHFREQLILNPLCNLVESQALQKRLSLSTPETRTTTALLALVRAGLGATILPESAMRDVGESPAFVEPADPPAHRHLHKICQPGRPFSPAVAAFWNCRPAIVDAT